MTCKGIALIRARQNGLICMIHAPDSESSGYCEYRVHTMSKSAARRQESGVLSLTLAAGRHSHSAADEPFITALAKHYRTTESHPSTEKVSASILYITWAPTTALRECTKYESTAVLLQIASYVA
jgi:hypothetical protein